MYKSRMAPACEIFYVRQDGTFVWKWRHVEQNGRVIESDRTYVLFYECITAARESGYQPQIKCK